MQKEESIPVEQGNLIRSESLKRPQRQLEKLPLKPSSPNLKPKITLITGLFKIKPKIPPITSIHSMTLHKEPEMPIE